MGRVRLPSIRAREAQLDAYEALAADTLHEVEPSRRSNRSTKSRRSNAKTTSQASDQTADGHQSDTMQEDHAGAGGHEDEAEPDSTLYCICLGLDTGEQPMIMCEACNNWFHFGCIGLDKLRAAQIEAYCCDICSEMGLGQTTTIDGKPFSSTLDAGPGSPPPAKDFSDNESMVEDNDDEDDDYVSGEERRHSRSQRPRISSTGGRRLSGAGETERSRRSREKSKAAGTQSRNNEDGEFLDDSDDDLAPARKRPRPAKRTSATDNSADSGAVVDALKTDKTRTHCTNQLRTIFKSIFAASDAEVGAAGVDQRASSFAEDVESELFDSFAEVEKNVRGPRTKYVAKFRSLHFNLRTNAVFRSRISSNELSPKEIVHMSADDLLTPELKAMADSVRAASLKHSVKEALVAPTAKRTHKGEEVLETSDVAAIAAQEDKEMAQREQREGRQRSTSATQAGGRIQSATTSPIRREDPADSALAALSPREFSPEQDDRPHLTEAATSTGVDTSTATKAESPSSPVRRDSGTPGHDSENAEAGEMAPPASRPRARSSFDMSSIFSKIKAPVKTESQDPAEVKETEEADTAADFDPAKTNAADEEDDDFEDTLLRGESAGPRKPRTAKTALEDRPQVWSGDVLVTDEGGFPGFAVQAGGRYVGGDASVWSKLLPAKMSTDGRIPTATAVKYLIECAISPSRELFVLVMMPDLAGPSEAAPYKPAKDKCLAKYQHIIDFYTKKDRIGVIAPRGELKRIVKDIYLLPLRKDETLPEYIELLDEHDLPKSASRDRDLILTVVVAQKDVLPTLARPAPPPSASDSPSSSVATTSSSSLPSALPAKPASADVTPEASRLPPNQFDPAMLSKIDPSALNSLLANPGLLQNAFGPSSQLPPGPPPATAVHGYGPPAAAFPQAPVVGGATLGGGAWNGPAAAYGSFGPAPNMPFAPGPFGGGMSPPPPPGMPGYGPPGGQGVTHPYTSGSYSPYGGPAGGHSSMESARRDDERSPPGATAGMHPSRAALIQGYTRGDQQSGGRGRGGGRGGYRGGRGRYP